MSHVILVSEKTQDHEEYSARNQLIKTQTVVNKYKVSSRQKFEVV